MIVSGYPHGNQVSFFTTANDAAPAATNTMIAPAGPSSGSAPAAAAQSTSHDSFFDDLLDVINPLQHLPVISTIYRAITGDKIGDVEQVAGDTLYGGLIGFGSSVANLIFKDATGKSVGDTVLGWLGIEDRSETPTGVAATTATDKTVAATAPAKDFGDTVLSWLGINDSGAAPTAVTAITAPDKNLAAATAPATTAAPKASMTAHVSKVRGSNALLAAFNAKGVDPALGRRALVAYQKTIGLNRRLALQP